LDLGISVVCKKGNLQDYPNQDNYFIYADSHTKLISLLDGHGPFGHLVSYYTSVTMAKKILEDPLYIIDPLESLKQCYKKITKQLTDMVRSHKCPFDTHLSGTSATTVLIKDNRMYIAHVGDIKVMRGKKNKMKKSIVLEALTNDHVPSLPDEKKRIYHNGGEVRKLHDDCTERIFVRGRVFPCLSTSRSLGNDIGGMIGVISEPDIHCIEITSQDLFILVGSDPFFSYLDDNEILNVMNYASKSKLKEVTDLLIKRAKNAWVQSDNNCFDDMSLILLYF